MERSEKFKLNIYLIFALLTGIIGYTKNDNSIFWGIVDFIFPIFCWIKWIIFQEINLTLIHESFSWFFK